MAFEDTEEVGHVIVQPSVCLYLRARVCACICASVQWMQCSLEITFWCNIKLCQFSFSEGSKEKWQLIYEQLLPAMQTQVNDKIVPLWRKRN